jgi:hypothetical protein
VLVDLALHHKNQIHLRSKATGGHRDQNNSQNSEKQNANAQKQKRRMQFNRNDGRRLHSRAIRYAQRRKATDQSFAENGHGRQSNPELAKAFETHKKETEQQIQLIEKAVKSAGVKLKREKCDAMEGLITKARKVIKEVKEGPVR